MEKHLYSNNMKMEIVQSYQVKEQLFQAIVWSEKRTCCYSKKCNGKQKTGTAKITLIEQDFGKNKDRTITLKKDENGNWSGEICNNRRLIKKLGKKQHTV